MNMQITQLAAKWTLKWLESAYTVWTLLLATALFKVFYLFVSCGTWSQEVLIVQFLFTSDGWSYERTCWSHYGTGTTPCNPLHPLTKTYMILNRRPPSIPCWYFSSNQKKQQLGWRIKPALGSQRWIWFEGVQAASMENSMESLWLIGIVTNWSCCLVSSCTFEFEFKHIDGGAMTVGTT